MTFLQRTAEFFRANPDQWLRATAFEAVGGRQAWRSRIAECRTVLGMRIENRQRRVTDLAGHTYIISEYRWVSPGAAKQSTLLLTNLDSSVT